MSELVLNWLNNEVGLSTNVTNFEKDFANGYLFGEILHKFRQHDEFHLFDNRNTYEAKLANFTRLEPTFKAVGIKFSASHSNAIMTGERGAALRLLYQLKMSTERLLLASEKSKGGMGQGAPMGGGVTKGIRVPRDKFDEHEKRFFEHRLRATCLNVKQARVDKLVRKFDEERLVQQQVSQEMERLEQERIAEQRDIHRYAQLERMRANRAAKDDWEQHGQEAWEQNMKVRRVHEENDIRFQHRTTRKQAERTLKVREGAAAEVHDGVEAFEEGLSALNLFRKSEERQVDDESLSSDDPENQADRLLARATPASDTKAFAEAIQAKMPNGQELEQEAGGFLQKIKESKRAGSLARKERERRRRRVLVELHKEQETLEESKLEEVLLEKLGRQSVQEKEINYSVWRTQKYGDVIVHNRQLRQQEYSARRKKDQQEAIQRDEALLQEMLESIGEQVERERKRYRAIGRGRRAQCRAQLSEECEGILDLVSSMAFASMQQEQLTDNRNVDETLWREWTQLFVEGVAVESSEAPAKSVTTMHPVTSVPPEPDASDTCGTILDAAALRDYVEVCGQWAVQEISRESDGSHRTGAAGSADGSEARGAEPVAAGEGRAAGESGEEPAPVSIHFDVAAEVKAVLEPPDDNHTQPPLSFLDSLSEDVDSFGGRPVNFRLGVIVGALLDRIHAEPPRPEPPPMPDVPLRLVLTGKPFAGKRTLAARLAENYNLHVVDVDETLKECLLLSKRGDAASHHVMDLLAVNHFTTDDHCQRHEELGNPFVRYLREIGYEVQQVLDRGDAIPNELYVHMITTKIRSLFHDRLPRVAPVATSEGKEEPEEPAEAGPVAAGSEGEARPGSVADEEAAQPAGSRSSKEERSSAGLLEDVAAVQAPIAGASGWDDGTSGIVSDTVLGDIAEAPIDTALEPCGWILVGFPDDAQRLQLLERFLSGWVAPSANPMPMAEVKKREAALLVPRPPEQPPPFMLVPGGYDIHIRLCADNDELVRRAVGRRLDPATSLVYHLEDSPPCGKSRIIYERLVPMADVVNSAGTLTQRMHAFDMAQPEVDTLLSFFGPFPDAPRLQEFAAEEAADAVHDAIDEQVAMLLERKQGERAKMLEAKRAEAAAAAAAEAAKASVTDQQSEASGGSGGPEEAPPAEAPPAPAPETKAAAGRRGSSPQPPAGGAGAGRRTSKEAVGQAEAAGHKDAAGQPADAAARSAASTPVELVQLTSLPKYVEDLEEPIFKLLLQEWRELQDNFSASIGFLFQWHRKYLSDFRRGLHGMKVRFVHYLSRPDDKQALVDSFVQRFNAFSEEYPDMRKQDAAKEELHQQVDDLEELLLQQVQVRKDQNLVELDGARKSEWVESQLQVLAAQIQHVVRLEGHRYHASCQLLCDFYHSAIGVGLPEPLEPLPKIEALTPDETGAPRLRVGRDPNAEEAPPPPATSGTTHAAAQAAAQAAAAQAAAQAPPPPGAPMAWEYPFLDDLMAQARVGLLKPVEYTPPCSYEKKEEPPEPKSKSKSKAKPGRTSPPVPKSTAPTPAPVSKPPPPPLFVDLQQALLAERVHYQHRLHVLRNWAERRLHELTNATEALFLQLRDWVMLRKKKEVDAIGELTEAIKQHIEDEQWIEAQLTVEGSHLHNHPNVLLRAPVIPPEPPWSVENADRSFLDEN